MADWIKLSTDMFSNRKIKHIRKMDDGNNIALIWVMLLSIAGLCNQNGYLVFCDDIPYDDELLAEETGFSIELIHKAMETFIRMKMIYLEGGYYAISGWEEYQNIEGLDKVREQTKERVAKYRNRHKDNGNVTSNVTVTLRNATEIEEEKEIRNKNKKESKRESKGLSFLDL